MITRTVIIFDPPPRLLAILLPNNRENYPQANIHLLPDLTVLIKNYLLHHCEVIHVA